MSQVSQATQQNASASEELSATAEEMSSQSLQLQELMAFFKVASASTGPAAKPQGKVRMIQGGKSPRVQMKTIEAGSAPDEKEFVKF
jgi:methyl-accepting chemotaxis protein